MALQCTAISPLLLNRLRNPGLVPLISSHGNFNLVKSFSNFLQIPESANVGTRKLLHRSGTQRICCVLNVMATNSIQLTPSNALSSPHLYDVCESTQKHASDLLEGSYMLPKHLQRLTLADLDPATAKVAIGILGPFLSAFGLLFILRIVMSWYPKLPVGKFPYVIAYAPTEPLLSQTRKVIPPVGGVDVTPVVWFALVSFLNEILVGPQGLLVLLSQQV
ncbi:cofactor assembly, complex C (B6F) [Tasmannia lanceolata]|uniref:cofactor assembly, complex C (B6F) n=1 Tax=Tasmannia lanceolata TaxID=3420 RepID=UPI00406463AA